MFQQTQFLDIIFLALVAFFLFMRLRSVLGTRPEKKENAKMSFSDSFKIVDISEYRTLDKSFTKNPSEEENISEIVSTSDSDLVEILEKIKKEDATFTVKGFLDKASKAFEYIADSFASGDKDALRPLLSKDLYDKFAAVIDERNERKETVEFSLIGFDSIDIVKAALFGSIAELTVEFVTDQTGLVKDKDGNILQGNPTYIETVVDVWTLRKDIKSSNPVWILSATKQKSK